MEGSKRHWAWFTKALVMVSLQGQRVIRSCRSQPRTWKAKTKCYIIKCWRLTAAVLKETRVEWFTTFFYFWKWTHCSRFGIFFYLKYKKITVIVLRLIVRSEGISCMYMDLSIILSLSGWEFQKSVFRIRVLLSWSGSGSDFYPESGLAKKSGSDPDPWKKKMWKYLTHFAGNII